MIQRCENFFIEKLSSILFDSHCHSLADLANWSKFRVNNNDIHTYHSLLMACPETLSLPTPPKNLDFGFQTHSLFFVNFSYSLNPLVIIIHDLFHLPSRVFWFMLVVSKGK